MITSIDWMSFTFHQTVGEGGQVFRFWQNLQPDLFAAVPSSYHHLFLGRDYEPRRGRAPYSMSWHCEQVGTTVFAHPALPHALVEVSGKGCQMLGELEYSDAVLAEVQPYLTRIDIACDMKTDTLPEAFVLAGRSERFKSFGHVASTSGETYYVGSRQSDRYARVYRYFPPHPRAEFLRCEFVLKAEQARVAAASIMADGLGSYSAALGNSFGWQHADWKPDVSTDEEARAWRPERRQGKTVRWLHAQVLPSLVKLHKEGIVDVRAFFTDVVLPKLDS